MTEEEPAFPAREPPSFCSRPTPVIPAPEDLRQYRSESSRPTAFDGIRPVSARPSSRPTLAPNQVEEPPAPSLVAPVIPAPEEPGARASQEAPSIEIGQAVTLEPEARYDSELRSATTPPLRRLLARTLFVFLFAGVSGLLGYAYKTQLTEVSQRVQRLV